MPRAPIGPQELEAGPELSAILFARVVMFSAVALLNKEPTRQYRDMDVRSGIDLRQRGSFQY